MPNHLALLTGTVGTSDVALTPVSDAVIPRATEFFQMSRPWRLIGAGAVFSAIAADSGAVLDIPSYAELGLPAIAPILDGTGARYMLDLSMTPIALQVGDPIGARVAAQAAGTPTAAVALIFADRLVAPSTSPMFFVRYSATFAATAGAWTPADLVLATRLPAGRYNILAMRHSQTNANAARLVLADSPMRPGALAIASTNPGAGEGQTMPSPQVTGVIGDFDIVAPPSIEAFGISALGTSATGLLLLQRADAKGGCGCSGAGCACGGA